MATFPQTPAFTGFNTPSRIEADLADLAHEGEIPRELDGAFYRVQPDPQFPPRLGDDISFNGDGMIGRFHFHEGRCDFRQRRARTDKWKLENAAGKGLFGACRNPLTDGPAVKGRIRGTANTSAWLFGGKLWALKEDSPALAMDPATMETVGYETFGGRMTDAEIRWFKRGNCFASHAMNAWQEGTKVHFVTPESKNNFFPFFPDVHGAPFNPMESVTHLTEWVVDMASNGEEFAEVRRLSDIFSEFPRIDDRFTGRRNRYTWGLEVDFRRPVEEVGGSAGGAPMNCLFLKDLETGAEHRWWAGPTSTLQEPCFIPRGRDAPEGDGWIVQVCNRLAEHGSDLLLFDALEIEKGPIATVQVPIRLRFGLHGNFAPSAELGLAA